MSVASQPPKPRFIGRSVRILLGAALLYFFAQIVAEIAVHGHGFFAMRPGWGIPGGDWGIAAIFCFFALPTIINSGFGRHWGGWPRLVFLFPVAGAILWDRIVYGSFWAWPLASLVLLLLGYVLAHAGISYLVAGLAATPG